MIEITTLDNGLKVATDTMKETETVTVTVWAHTGSRHENEAKNGISHFLEHMAFKGTHRRTAKKLAEEIDAVGGHMNAGTSREYTTYYIKVLKEHANLAFDILGDIIQNSTFEKEELERERNVILQEIAMTNDTPDDIVFDYFQQTAFPNQPLGRPILGTVKHIQRVTQKDLKDYIAAYYNAQSVLISVAGNISHDQVVAYAKKHFGHFPKGKKITPRRSHYKGGEYRIQRDLEQIHWLIGFKSVSYYDDPDIYKARLLSYILGGGMASRLFQEVREKRGLAYSVSAFTSSYADGGLFTVYAGTGPGQIEKLCTVVANVLKKTAESITRKELDRARAQAKANLLMSRENSSSRADDLGKQLTFFNRPIPLEETLTKLEAITKDDLTSMMEHFITNAPPTITAIGKLDKLQPYETMVKKLAS